MSKYKPIEMPRSKRYGNNYWKSYSIKENRIVTFYSDLEYKNWLTVEMNPEIVHFCEQPLQIDVVIDSKKYTSVFDMWVEKKDGAEEFWEVKYMKSLSGDDQNAIRTKQQIEKQIQWCKNNYFQHAIRTENEIELGPEYINNLRYLAHLCKTVDLYKDVNPYRKNVSDFLKSENKSVKEIMQEEIIVKNKESAVLAYLIYDGTIKADLETAPFSHETEVMLNG